MEMQKYNDMFVSLENVESRLLNTRSNSQKIEILGITETISLSSKQKLEVTCYFSRLLKRIRQKLNSKIDVNIARYQNKSKYASDK